MHGGRSCVEGRVYQRTFLIAEPLGGDKLVHAVGEIAGVAAQHSGYRQVDHRTRAHHGKPAAVRLQRGIDLLEKVDVIVEFRMLGQPCRLLARHSRREEGPLSLFGRIIFGAPIDLRHRGLFAAATLEKLPSGSPVHGIPILVGGAAALGRPDYEVICLIAALIAMRESFSQGLGFGCCAHRDAFAETARPMSWPSSKFTLVTAQSGSWVNGLRM